MTEQDLEDKYRVSKMVPLRWGSRKIRRLRRRCSRKMQSLAGSFMKKFS